jgi:hypothetical protein
MSNSMRLIVEPPVFTPSPYGLLTAVQPRPGTDPHWQMGVTWEDICGGAGATLDACDTSAPAITGVGMIPAKAPTTGRTLWGATPFTVFVEVDCSPVDFYENQAQTMKMALDRYESYQVERTFWTGLAPEINNTGGVANGVLPHLAYTGTPIVETSLGRSITLQQSATIVTGAALNATDALGVLEGALANCLNGTGVIHVPQALAPTLALLTQRQGNKLISPNGNIIAIGAGYPGTSPAGATPALGTSWMYATGPIFMYRSEPKMRLMENGASLVRSTNLVKAIIERTYVLGYDCCLVAQLVNTSSFFATSISGP